MNCRLCSMLPFTFLFLNTGACPVVDNTNPVLKPNVLILLADGMGYGDISCYGQSK